MTEGDGPRGVPGAAVGIGHGSRVLDRASEEMNSDQRNVTRAIGKIGRERKKMTREKQKVPREEQIFPNEIG